MARGYATDLEIEILAANEIELRARVRDLERERDGYQLLARVALSQLHDRGKEFQRLEASYHRLLDERREQRQQGTAA